MFKLLSVLVVLCLCFIVPLALAQDDETPTIALLRFGSAFGPSASPEEAAVIEMLTAFGMLDLEDRLMLLQRQEYMGEKVNIIWGDAGFDFNNSAQMVEAALDQGADLLITVSTPVTQAAINATLDMDNPPAIIFATVFNPIEAGIIQSSCVKPDHVTGSEAYTPYEEVLPILLLQAPDAEVIGTIFNPAEASGASGAAQIVAIGESFGLRVEQAAVTSMTDMRAAALGLVSKGVEIILLPTDMTTLGGLPAIVAVANENSIPIFHANVAAINSGATIGAGFDLFYEQGLHAGSLAGGYLLGDLDIAKTTVFTVNRMGVGLNLDSAAALGMDIKPELLEMSELKLEDGNLSAVRRNLMERFELILPMESLGEDTAAIMQTIINFSDTAEAGYGVTDDPGNQPIEVMLRQMMQSPIGQAMLKMMFQTLQCTDEMIAEQQAALAAMEG